MEGETINSGKLVSLEYKHILATRVKLTRWDYYGLNQSFKNNQRPPPLSKAELTGSTKTFVLLFSIFLF